MKMFILNNDEGRWGGAGVATGHEQDGRGLVVRV
jgi:hypothetical protein